MLGGGVKRQSGGLRRGTPAAQHVKKPTSMTTPAPFNSVALIGRYADPRVAESLHVLAGHLAARKRAIVVDAAAEAQFSVSVTRVPEADLSGRADLIVAVGGD